MLYLLDTHNFKEYFFYEAAQNSMSLLENALDSLLVEAAFAFPREDSAFLIQLSALKVSVMYKQNQALDKDQQFNLKAFYFVAYLLPYC